MNVKSTCKIERKLKKNNLQRPYEVDVLDVLKAFDSLSVKGKIEYDQVKSTMRLLRSPFQARQRNWLIRQIHEFNAKSVRMLTKLPEDFKKCNEVRDSLIEIQQQAKQAVKYVPVANDEEYPFVKSYFSKKDASVVPVIDLMMDELTFAKLVDWATKRGLVVLLNSEYEQIEQNIHFVLNKLTSEQRNNIHVYGVYWSLTNSEDNTPLAETILAKGIGSISFDSPPFPPYIVKHIHNKPPKSANERLAAALWMNPFGDGYLDIHPTNCPCGLTDKNISALVSKDLRAAQMYHNMYCAKKTSKFSQNTLKELAKQPNALNQFLASAGIVLE